MKLLPYETIVYYSKLSPTEVLDNINANTEPKNFFRSKGFFADKNPKIFEGIVTGKAFEITPIIDYKNAFLPQIRGIVTPERDGSMIKVKIGLNDFASAFLVLWSMLAILFFIASIFTTGKPPMSEGIDFFPLGMLLFAYLLCMFFFSIENSTAKEHLEKIIAASTQLKSV